MNLSQLIVPSLTVKSEFPGYPGFEVELAYLTRDEIMNLRKKATTKNINRKTRAVEEEVDNDLFQSIYIQAVIKGWTGLKYKYLPKLAPVDISGVTDKEEELEFSVENAEALMKNASGFDSWVTEMLDDVENFTQGS